MSLRVNRWAPLVMCGVLIACPVGSAQLSEPDAEYAVIQRAFLREDYAEVVDLSEAFLDHAADAAKAPRVRVWLAMSVDRLERPGEALRILDELQRHLEDDDPMWPEVLFWDGDISRRAARMLRAKLAWTRLLEGFADSAWASDRVRFGLGMVYISQQAFRYALAYFESVETRTLQDPMTLEARLLEGLCLLRLQRFEDALATFHPLLKQLRDPDDAARAAFYLGEALSGLDRHEEAIPAYQRAIQARPDSSWSGLSRFGIGWAQFQLGRCEASLDTFTRYGHRIVAGHAAEALFAQGSCLVRLGDDEEASELLQRVRTRHPLHRLAGESGLLLADLDRRAGRPRQAAALLERLLAQTANPSSRVALHLRLGVVRLDHGDAARAADHFQAALELPELETRLAALNGLGDVQMYLGEYQQARRRYGEVRVLSADAGGRAPTPHQGDPRQVPVRQAGVGQASDYARYQLGRIQFILGESEEAIQTFHELMTQVEPPLVDDTRLALALAYIHEQDEERARGQLDAIRQTRRGSVVAARAAYYLAILALADGVEAQVRGFCEEAVAGAPDSTEGIEARILLAEMDVGRGSIKEAVARLDTALRTPTLGVQHRARLAKKLGDFSRLRHAYAEAIHWYELAAQWWPSVRGEVTYRMASCYEQAGDIDVAISRYRSVLDPEWMVRGQLAAAKLLERQGRWAEVETVYERLARASIPEAKVAQEHLALLRGELTTEEREP